MVQTVQAGFRQPSPENTAGANLTRPSQSNPTFCPRLKDENELVFSRRVHRIPSLPVKKRLATSLCSSESVNPGEECRINGRPRIHFAEVAICQQIHRSRGVVNGIGKIKSILEYCTDERTALRGFKSFKHSKVQRTRNIHGRGAEAAEKTPSCSLRLCSGHASWPSW
jgi:hypothetical protein